MTARKTATVSEIISAFRLETGLSLAVGKSALAFGAQALATRSATFIVARSAAT